MSERRSQVLTAKDLEMLEELMQKNHRVCVLGITPEVAQVINKMTAEEWGILHRCLVSVGRAANIIGGAIILALASGMITIVVKGIGAIIVAKKGN